MPSASRRYIAGVLGLGLALMLWGCTTTQTTAARLQLNDARLRSASEPVRVQVGETNTSVSVSRTTVLSTRRSFTAAITLENNGDTALSDLPVSVGYRRGPHVVYLNGGTEVRYFDNHVPAIPAHGSLTWVVTGTAAPLPRHARIFARVGARPSTPVGASTPPRIDVTRARRLAGATAGHEVLTVQVTNDSSIPQYQLPVYAIVTEGSHILAARDRSIAELAGGAKAVVRIVLPSHVVMGSRDSVRVEAPATIFK